jgi:hypothetical protein
MKSSEGHGRIKAIKVNQSESGAIWVREFSREGTPFRLASLAQGPEPVEGQRTRKEEWKGRRARVLGFGDFE